MINIEHGTPGGYDLGCRGIACTNHRTDLMTCTEAHVRFQGDYAYWLAVKAGTATAEKESYRTPKPPRLVLETAEEAAKRPAKVKAKRVPKVKQPKAPRAPREIMHGFPRGYVQGCHDRTLCPAPDGINCADAMKAHKLAIERAKGVQPRKQAKHGTSSGYMIYKCHIAEACPSFLDGGISCSEARSTYRASRPSRAKGAPAVERAPRASREVAHGTVYGFARGCKDESCPNVAKGGKSCAVVKREYFREYVARRKAGKGPAIKHGTPGGYQMGCITREGCPQPEGETCCDASLAAERDRRRRAGVEPRPIAKHGTRGGYRSLGCRSQTECPALAEGGESCYAVNSTYQSVGRQRRITDRAA